MGGKKRKNKNLTSKYRNFKTLENFIKSIKNGKKNLAIIDVLLYNTF